MKPVTVTPEIDHNDCVLFTQLVHALAQLLVEARAPGTYTEGEPIARAAAALKEATGLCQFPDVTRDIADELETPAHEAHPQLRVRVETNSSVADAADGTEPASMPWADFAERYRGLGIGSLCNIRSALECRQEFLGTDGTGASLHVRRCD